MVFHPVNDDAWVGLSDVVSSTAAIAAGRYKAVNMAGAAIISAVMNALSHEAFPFVFGGDGASFVVEPHQREAAEEALAACATFAAEEFGLELRVSMIPVRDIRAAGHDVKIARFAASPAVTYAMVSGGGIEWGEGAMKAGRYALPPAPPGTRPDLTNLSCRWSPIASRHGTILSLIVRAMPGADPAVFAATARRLLDIVEATDTRQGSTSRRGPENGRDRLSAPGSRFWLAPSFRSSSSARASKSAASTPLTTGRFRSPIPISASSTTGCA